MYDGPIIDAHHHLWELSSGRYGWLDAPRDTVFGTTEPLIRDYLIDDYLADMASLELVQSVHIQASFDQDDPTAETRWLHETAEARGFPHGVVGYAQLESAEAERVLAAQCAFPRMRGIRQIVSWHENPTWSFVDRPDYMRDDAWRRGYKLLRKYDLSFDLLLFPSQLRDAVDLAHAFPDTQIILNHTGSPADRDKEGLAVWREGITALAGTENAAVKISDLGAYDHHWTEESVRPFVLHTIDAFGASRCMFASDFPVGALHGDAVKTYDAFKSLVSDFTAAEQRALFHDNARSLYRLG